MKLGLIVDSNLWECPYVDIYTRILNTTDASYDLIVWDRDLSENSLEKRFSKHPNPIRKLRFFDYYNYARYVKQLISKNKYDKLIVFGQAIGIFLYRYLRKHYQHKYILDYRDIGIDQSLLFKSTFRSLVKDSNCTVVSSPGFIKFIPSCTKIYLSHNFNEDLVEKSLSLAKSSRNLHEIKILTIGAIRNFEANSQIMDALGNIDDFQLSFVGKGPASIDLERYAIKMKYNNVDFFGKYNKNEEENFVEDSNLINLYLPNIPSHINLMANRFYLALIHRKPMITNRVGVQGNYVKNFNLGIPIDTTENLGIKIKQWFRDNSFQDFERRCCTVMNLFLKDQEIFKQAVIDFVKNKY